jgi:phytanoyl-CoA hydroxylase
VVVVYGETFRKAPHIGSETPPHQDQVYHMRNMNAEPEEPVLALWIALDPVDKGNSCLRYVQGSHLKGLRPYSATTVHGFSLGMTDYNAEDEAQAVALCVEPGDAIIHHGLTIHRTDANKSDRERRALVCNYVPSELAARQK